MINTADSAGGMMYVHHRRTLVLIPARAREWLNPGTQKERSEEMELHQGEPSEVFEWLKVDTVVVNVGIKEPELTKPVSA